MLTASYIVGGIGIAAFLAARVIRSFRRAAEFIAEMRAEFDDLYDVNYGDEETR